MSFPFERLLPSSFDYGSRVQVAGVIDEITTFVKYSAPENQNTTFLPREVRSDLRKKGLFLFAKCYEHERLIDPLQHAQRLSLGCIPSTASSTGHLRLSDDHVTLLIKSHGRAAKAFADAGAPAAAAPLYAAAMRCWDELGDTARLQATVPDVGYTLFAWAAKLHWTLGSFDVALSLTERAATFLRSASSSSSSSSSMAVEADSLSRTCLSSALSLSLPPHRAPASALPWLQLADRTLGQAAPGARARRGRILRLKGACELAAGRLGAALEAADAAVASSHPANAAADTTAVDDDDSGACEALWLRCRVLAVIAAQADLTVSQAAAAGSNAVTTSSSSAASKWEDVSKSLTQAISHHSSLPSTLVGLLESVSAGAGAAADAAAAADAVLSPGSDWSSSDAPPTATTATPGATGSVSADAAAVVDRAFALARARWPSPTPAARPAAVGAEAAHTEAEAAAACIVSAQLRWLVRRGRYDAAASAAAALPARAPAEVRGALWALAAGDHAVASSPAIATATVADDDVGHEREQARARALLWLQQLLRITPGGERVVLSEPFARVHVSSMSDNDESNENTGEDASMGSFTVTLLPQVQGEVGTRVIDWRALSLILTAAAQCLLTPTSTGDASSDAARAYALSSAAAVLAALHGDVLSTATPHNTEANASIFPFVAAIVRNNSQDGRECGQTAGAAQVQRLRALLRLPGKEARARAQALLGSITRVISDVAVDSATDGDRPIVLFSSARGALAEDDDGSDIDDAPTETHEAEAEAALAAVSLPAPLPWVMGVAAPSAPIPLPAFASSTDSSSSSRPVPMTDPVTESSILPASASTTAAWVVSPDALCLIAEEAHTLGRPSVCARALRALLSALPNPGAGAAMSDGTSQSPHAVGVAQGPLLRALIKMDLQAAERALQASNEVSSQQQQVMGDDMGGDDEKHQGLHEDDCSTRSRPHSPSHSQRSPQSKPALCASDASSSLASVQQLGQRLLRLMSLPAHPNDITAAGEDLSQVPAPNTSKRSSSGLEWSEVWEVADCLWNAAAIASSLSAPTSTGSVGDYVLFLQAGTLYDALARTAIAAESDVTPVDEGGARADESSSSNRRVSAEARGVGLLGVRSLLMAAASVIASAGEAITINAMAVLQRARSLADLCCPSTTTSTGSAAGAGTGKDIDELRLLLAVLWFRTRLQASSNTNSDDEGARAYAEARALFPFPPRALLALAAEARARGQTAAAAEALRERLALALAGDDASDGESNHPKRLSPPLLLRCYRQLLAVLADRAASAHSAEAGAEAGVKEVRELLEGAVDAFERVWAGARQAIESVSTAIAAKSRVQANDTTGESSIENVSGGNSMSDNDEEEEETVSASAPAEIEKAHSNAAWEQLWEWDLYSSGTRGDVTDSDGDDADEEDDGNDEENRTSTRTRVCTAYDCSFCHPIITGTPTCTSPLARARCSRAHSARAAAVLEARHLCAAAWNVGAAAVRAAPTATAAADGREADCGEGVRVLALALRLRALLLGRAVAAAKGQWGPFSASTTGDISSEAPASGSGESSSGTPAEEFAEEGQEWVWTHDPAPWELQPMRTAFDTLRPRAAATK